MRPWSNRLRKLHSGCPGPIHVRKSMIPRNGAAKADADFATPGRVFTTIFFLKRPRRSSGTISLFNIDWKVPRFEIGYWLRTPHAGKGFMTEATAGGLASKMAFEQLKAERIEIRCDERNSRSA